MRSTWHFSLSQLDGPGERLRAIRRFVRALLPGRDSTTCDRAAGRLPRHAGLLPVLRRMNARTGNVPALPAENWLTEAFYHTREMRFSERSLRNPLRFCSIERS